MSFSSVSAEYRQGKGLLSPKGFAELGVCAVAVGKFGINSPLSCSSLLGYTALTILSGFLLFCFFTKKCKNV